MPEKKKKIFYVCGSINQTTQMHKISKELPEFEHYFSPYYGNKFEEFLRVTGLGNTTIIGEKLVNRCLSYLNYHDLKVDFGGKNADEYDLVVSCSDLVVQNNLKGKKMIVVQEGMTDPENFFYHLVKLFPILPRWIASTSTTGISDQYNYFCVASQGYADLFIRKGVKPEKIKVTGIPNFDDCAKSLKNDFPHKNFVLVCTSDARETFKIENRKAFIQKAVDIAKGRQIIFKLHPNENRKRAEREIKKWAPAGTLVFQGGVTEEMIANCDVLLTRFSSTVYVGIALGKEVYSDFDLTDLKRMTPIQNGGTSAANIATYCRELLDSAEAPVYSRAKVTNWVNADYAPELVLNLFASKP
ncbi:MAG: hypothetical protein SFU91_08785 [Chloroherpetonaceae bacterium]|nr:hypothetical protein [Chloroherpetonaceae bacterium]